MSTPNPTAVDVRPLPADRKLQTVLAVLGDLEVGDSFVLVDGRDPSTLRIQVEEEHPGEIRWEYLKKGPHVWHVRVVRLRVSA